MLTINRLSMTVLYNEKLTMRDKKEAEIFSYFRLQFMNMVGMINFTPWNCLRGTMKTGFLPHAFICIVLILPLPIF